MDNSQNASQSEVPWFIAPQATEPSAQQSLAQPPGKNEKPRRPGLKLAVVAFVLDSLSFFALGPVLLIFAIMLGGFAWILSFFYVYVLLVCSTFSIISAILYMAALVKSLKRQSPAVANVLIMSTAHVVGYAIIYLVVFSLIRIPTILMAILLTLCFAAPCVALIILHNHRKRSQQLAQPQAPNQHQKLQLTVAVTLAIILIEIIASVFYVGSNLATFIGAGIKAREQQTQLEQEMVASKGDKNISDAFADMTYAICMGDGYSIIHQKPGDTDRAIIQCHTTSEIYEVHNPNRRVDMDGFGNYLEGEAIYYGATQDDALDKYFRGIPYLYKNLRNASYPETVTLLFKGDSLDQVIDKYAPAILGYIHEARTTGLEFIILYNEKINDIKASRDFVVPAASLSSGDGIPTWLPNGNGVSGAKNQYILNSLKSLDVAEYVSKNYATTYSAQMRNAIKSHEHLVFSIEDPNYNGVLKQLTLEGLLAIMTSPNSCLRQNDQLKWENCSPASN